MPTCRVCGVDPLTWLRHVLTGLPQRREGRGRRLATVQLLQNLCGLTEPHTSPGSSALQRCSSRQCAWKIALTQAMALCDLIHHRAGPKALRNDLSLDLVRPPPVNLTSRLPGRENLQCILHGETPVARPWKGDHRSGRRGQCGIGTPVTKIVPVVSQAFDFAQTATERELGRKRQVRLALVCWIGAGLMAVLGAAE